MKLLLIKLFSFYSIFCFSQEGSNIINIIPVDKHIDTVATLCGIKMDSGPYSYKMRILNPTKKTIQYLNFSRTQPWYKVRSIDSDSIVKIQNAYFCLTEARYVLLHPGKCAYFYIYEDPAKVQIGIEYSIYPAKDKHITWSKLKLKNN